MMPSTSAERQRRYRTRHLKHVGGTKARLQAFVDLRTMAALRRMARHTGESITHLIDQLVADAERAITKPLSGAAYHAHHHPTGQKPIPATSPRRARDPEQIGALPLSLLHGRPSASGDASRYDQIRRIRAMPVDERVTLALQLGTFAATLRTQRKG
jgi:hypothetical protein